MYSLLMRKHCFLKVLIIFIFSIVFPVGAQGGATKINLDTMDPQKLALTVGKSVIIGSSEPVKRVSLGSQEIVDAIVLTPRQISVIGKTPGVTNLTIWGSDDKVSAIMDIQVSPDALRLREMVQRLFPEEKDLRIDATHDSLTLSGTVSSASSLSQVLSLAQSYLPKAGKVINLLEVAGVHQVMLEVRVAEMSRSLQRRLGFNWTYVSSSGKNIGLSLLNKLTALPSGGFPANPLVVSDKVTGIFRFMSHDTSWTLFIDALKEDGLLKVLAEPNLITLSGKTAHFLAGGEFPIPVPQASGVSTTITVEYKPFGVGLNFTPTVLNNKKINMEVAPEVSELDFSNAIQIQGFTIPAVTTRRVSTAIELADGQSFAIAGLLRDGVREIIGKWPLIGDIPVLGTLFRSSNFQKNETELIVIVTPHLVRPLDTAKSTLPTDQYIEPDDFEFYLLGHPEGQEKPKPSPGGVQGRSSKLEGDFGHILPK